MEGEIEGNITCSLTCPGDPHRIGLTAGPNMPICVNKADRSFVFPKDDAWHYPYLSDNSII